jgi:hypothetical protein
MLKIVVAGLVRPVIKKKKLIKYTLEVGCGASLTASLTAQKMYTCIFIRHSALQFHSHFQSEFSSECNLVLPTTFRKVIQ